MPLNWNSSGIFRMQYRHKTVPEASCWVTCVPLLKNLTVQGTFVNGPSEDNNVHTKLLTDDYVMAKGDFSCKIIEMNVLIYFLHFIKYILP